VGNAVFCGFLHFGKRLAVSVFYEERIVAEAASSSFLRKERSFAGAAGAFFDPGRRSQNDAAFIVSASIVIQKMLHLLEAPVHWIGLPPGCAKVFLFGFFRRDYGAAGLYDLGRQGMLTDAQLAVACVALTLFLPCIAQFLMNVKERGWRTGITISLFVLVFSFSVSYALSVALQATGLLS